MPSNPKRALRQTEAIRSFSGSAAAIASATARGAMLWPRLLKSWASFKAALHWYIPAPFSFPCTTQEEATRGLPAVLEATPGGAGGGLLNQAVPPEW
jgi:hypothetical protein